MGVQKGQSNHDNNTANNNDSHNNNSEKEEQKPQKCGFYYLTPQAARNIPLYKFRGEDRSLMYKYLLSPLAQFLVDKCTPQSIAPNVITFSGLIIMFVAYCAVWYYVPNLKVEKVQDETTGEEEFDVPRWIFLYNCIAMLVYQTLDNMDGKQARRTKSSSPLGLLFDHGCDAINSIFGSANWIVAMGLDPFDVHDGLLCWVIVLGPYVLFYIATWEEYYTGELILPLFNGPNEGLFGGAMLSLTTYYCGPQFWHDQSWYDAVVLPILSKVLPSTYLGSLPILRNADLVVLASCIGFFQEMLLKMTFTIGKYGYQAFLDVLPVMAVSIATLVIGYYDRNIWLNMPRTSLHLVAALIVEMVTEMMRMHISQQKFRPFGRWLIAPLLILAAIIVASNANGFATPSWIGNYVMIYTAAACTYLFMKLGIVVDEICRVLNIWCFDIVTPRKQQYYVHETPHQYLSTNGGEHLKHV